MTPFITNVPVWLFYLMESKLMESHISRKLNPPKSGCGSSHMCPNASRGLMCRRPPAPRAIMPWRARSRARVSSAGEDLLAARQCLQLPPYISGEPTLQSRMMQIEGSSMSPFQQSETMNLLHSRHWGGCSFSTQWMQALGSDLDLGLNSKSNEK